MTNFIIKPKRLFILIFSLLLVIVSKAQNLEQTVAFADSLKSNNNISSAIREYKRALFFTDGNYIAYIQKQLGDCYFEVEQYGKAAEYYEHTYFSLDSDSLKNEIIFQKVACKLFSKHYQHALAELYNVNYDLSDYFHKKYEFYFGMTYWGLKNFRLAEQSFINALDSTRIFEKEQIKLLCSDKKRMYRPNPRLVKVMSMIVPGLGQVYTGDLKNGVNSLFLTSSLFTFGVYTTVQYSFLDSFISIFPWFFRYYKGGYLHAKTMAESKQTKRRDEVFREILLIIATTK